MRVLIAEDEVELRRSLARMLEVNGFAVDQADDGQEALKIALQEPYDALIVDLGLPQLDGISVIHRLRAAGNQTPVLILTARGRMTDKVSGFNAGADDYLTKPFEMEELLLRVRALIRRTSGQASAVLTCGPVSMDTQTGRVSVNGLPLQLTQQEFRILAYFMHHPGRIISRQTLMSHIYDRHTVRESNVVDVLLARIRRKLSVNIIQTVRGQGYRLAMPRA